MATDFVHRNIEYHPEPTYLGKCFLSEDERKDILNVSKNDSVTAFQKALEKRVLSRLAYNQLLGPNDNTAWWYVAFEYISDASMLFAIYQDQKVGLWIKENVLFITRKPQSEWVGPWFRDHSEPFTGHLETAHVCWALATAVDLASDAFTAIELAEVKKALAEKGIPLCKKWLEKNYHLANWRGIMLAGVLVSAAVLNDTKTLECNFSQIEICLNAFQPDGSYSESLQYGNYLAFSLMLIYESLYRKYPKLAANINIKAYAGGLDWITCSMFYAKPLSGWGMDNRPRAANFNDSAAMFRPSGDLLLHISTRCKNSSPTQAGLSSYLFQKYYEAIPEQGPNNLASFGFINDWGFLSIPLMTYSRKMISPESANIPLTVSFSNGNAFYRDAWNGKIIIAIQGGADPLCAPGHLHGDVNSFILSYNNERLLVDPGHSCYRNLIHGLESSSQTHNTCTFLLESEKLGLQEDAGKSGFLEQRSVSQRRTIMDDMISPPIVRGNRKLINERFGNVSVIGAEASHLYNNTIKEFSRFWIMCGSNTTIVVDRIVATLPVRTIWNWLFNNRDGLAELTELDSNEVQVKRPQAGLKILSSPEVAGQGPVYSFTHDAYHPEPNQKGEGKSGSALLYRWTELKPKDFRVAVHVIVADEPDQLHHWKLKRRNSCYHVKGQLEDWSATILSDRPLKIKISSIEPQLYWVLEEINQSFVFTKIDRAYEKS